MCRGLAMTAHLVDEGHAGIGKVPFDLPHVHVLLQRTKRQRAKQLLGRKNGQ